MVPPVPTPEIRIVNRAVGVIPYFRAGSVQVNRRVGGIVELLNNVAIGCLFQDLVGLGDSALHAVGAGREHNLRPVGQQRDAPLQTGMVSGMVMMSL